jgi:hypothetical protein
VGRLPYPGNRLGVGEVSGDTLKKFRLKPTRG